MISATEIQRFFFRPEVLNDAAIDPWSHRAAEDQHCKTRTQVETSHVSTVVWGLYVFQHTSEFPRGCGKCMVLQRFATSCNVKFSEFPRKMWEMLWEMWFSGNAELEQLGMHKTWCDWCVLPFRGSLRIAFWGTISNSNQAKAWKSPGTKYKLSTDVNAY